MNEEISLNDIARVMVRAAQKSMNEDFAAPIFLTNTITDIETGEKFEFTVRKHEGMTPAEKLNELQKELDERKESRE